MQKVAHSTSFVAAHLQIINLCSLDLNVDMIQKTVCSNQYDTISLHMGYHHIPSFLPETWNRRPERAAQL